ncbi:MAG: hypothetical protein ABIB71_08775 [Candidatus Woesearchaeota archaeon]
MRLLIVCIISLMVISGCSWLGPKVEEKESGIEHIGGKYNLTLHNVEITRGDSTFTIKRISYEKEGEMIDPDQILPDEMRPGLDWLKANSPEDAVVMAWWDYGNAIRAYAEREPVIDGPSKEILTKTVSKHIGKNPEEIECNNCIAHERIDDVANLLVSEDSSYVSGIMQKYSASYLYINKGDEGKSRAIFISAGKEQKDISSTIIGKALGKERINGFELAYDDNACVIYKLL